jgi:hypothetical protein
MNLARGEILSLEQGWQLARGWYHDRLRADWQRKTVEESQSFFTGLGLTGPFWTIVPAS